MYSAEFPYTDFNKVNLDWIADELKNDKQQIAQNTADIEELKAGGTVIDYEDLQNLPEINGVTLIGDKSLDDIGAASADEVSDLKSAIDDMLKGDMPFKIVQDEYIDKTDGSIISYNGWDRTNYIPVDIIASFVAKNGQQSDYNAFYDANKGFISSFTVKTTDLKFVVPNNAKYVVFSSSRSGMAAFSWSITTKDEADIDSLEETQGYISESFGYLDIPVTVTAQNTFTVFPFLQGKTYKVTNNTAGNVNLYTCNGSINDRVDRIAVPLLANSEATFTASANANYINIYALNTGDILVECEGNYVSDIIDTFDENSQKIDDLKENNYPLSVVADEYINKTTGAIESYVGWSRTDYTKCVGKDYLIVDGSANTDYNAFYDKGKNFIYSFSVRSGRTEIAIPDNAYYFIISANTTQLVTVHVMIATVEEWLQTIPEYYFANNYLPNKISSIITAMENCVANGDAFVFITDIHWDKNARQSPKLINYLYRKINITRLFNGGDNYDGKNSIVTRNLRRAIESDKVITAVGNHDWFVHATPSELYYDNYMYGFNFEYGNRDELYYYVDNEQQKIRYIVLGAYGEQLDSDGNYVSRGGYTQSQADWLESVMPTTGGYTFVIITHALYSNTDYSGAIVYDVPNYTLIQNVLDNYSGDGVVACVLQGHVHLDKVTHTPGGIPVIWTTCDKPSTETDPLAYARSKGTIDEQAFDVCILDKTNRKITLVRVGAKALNGIDNNLGTQVEYREVTY